MKRTILLISRRVLLLMQLVCPLAASGQQADMSKLSAYVRQLYALSGDSRNGEALQRVRSGAVASRRSQSSRPGSLSLQLTAFVRISADGSRILSENGCSELARFGNIYVARIPFSSLSALSADSRVRRIEANRPCTVTMDTVARCVDALPVYAGEQLPQPYTGSGVVVGVMDIGFDLTHPNFFSADQSHYRIARLWDQLGHSEGTDLGTFVEGREALISYGHTVDGLLLGHGTHTAGTAAGSGHATPYRGMAFDSELCLVANATSNNMELIPEEEQPLYTSATDALGFKYIFDYAQSVGKPCVVSFSEGAIDSYYGDSELYDEVLASMVGPGRILVASAGNDGERKQFFHKPATEECGTFIRGPRDKAYIMCATPARVGLRTVIYHQKPDTISFVLDAATAPTDTIEVNDTLQLSSGQYVFQFVSYPSRFDVGVRACEMLITAPSIIGLQVPVSVEVTGKEGEADFHLLVGTMSQNSINPLLTSGEATHQVLSPGSAPAVICVGATTHRNTFVNTSGNRQTSGEVGNGALAAYSSRGPTLDGRTKPDVVAPGTFVMSSYNHFFLNDNPDNFFHRWTIARTDFAPDGGAAVSYPWGADEGTSMSTPVVSGAIALWLEACPSLTPEQVKDVLAATCKPVVLPSGEMPLQWPNNFAGYGEIDVYAGLVEVLNRYVTGIDTISRHQPAAVGCRLSADGFHVSIDASVAEPVTLRLFSVGGQLVASRHVCGGGETVIPMTAAGSGVYVLQSQSKDKAAAGSVVFRK